MRAKIPIWAVLTIMISSLMGCYILQQGSGQFELLSESEPIAEIIDDEETSAYRDLLGMVAQVLEYCEEYLLLDTKKNYRDYYHTDNEGITYVVTASSRLIFEPYEWWFPIVGHVPYKGFFDLADAVRQSRTLQERGYDVWMGSVVAYSTLGWFNDPVTTPMLKQGAYYLVSTIIHESVHTTLYINGEGNFNEQLASFVASIATPDFFMRYHPEGEQLIAAQQEQNIRNDRFFTLMHEAYQKADALYQETILSDQQKLRYRAQLFADIEADIAQDPAISNRAATVNNARLLQFRRYQEDNPIFKKLWDRSTQRWDIFWDIVENRVETLGVAKIDEW